VIGWDLDFPADWLWPRSHRLGSYSGSGQASYDHVIHPLV
jgi:hypothetical protein